MWESCYQGDDPNAQTDPLGRSRRRSATVHLQWGRDGIVPCHAHGGQEKYAGVHVHSGDRADDFAHNFAEGPAEVQRCVYGPER